MGAKSMQLSALVSHFPTLLVANTALPKEDAQIVCVCVCVCVGGGRGGGGLNTQMLKGGSHSQPY